MVTKGGNMKEKINRIKRLLNEAAPKLVQQVMAEIEDLVDDPEMKLNSGKKGHVLVIKDGDEPIGSISFSKDGKHATTQFDSKDHDKKMTAKMKKMGIEVKA